MISDVLGIVLVLAGLYMILKDLSGVNALSSASGGIWGVIAEIFKTRPNTAIGIVLIILGGVFLGPISFGDLVGGDASNGDPSPSPSAS